MKNLRCHSNWWMAGLRSEEGDKSSDPTHFGQQKESSDIHTARVSEPRSRPRGDRGT
jgi:hypothetical protein